MRGIRSIPCNSFKLIESMKVVLTEKRLTMIGVAIFGIFNSSRLLHTVKFHPT